MSSRTSWRSAAETYTQLGRKWERAMLAMRMANSGAPMRGAAMVMLLDFERAAERILSRQTGGEQWDNRRRTSRPFKDAGDMT